MCTNVYVLLLVYHSNQQHILLDDIIIMTGARSPRLTFLVPPLKEPNFLQSNLIFYFAIQIHVLCSIYIYMCILCVCVCV